MNSGRLVFAVLVGTVVAACGSSAESSDDRTSAPCVDASCGADAAAPQPSPDAAPAAPACTGDEGLTQVAGDCKRARCDATGVVISVADDTDVPAADACTEPVCAGGQKIAKPRAAGTACGEGACDGKGTCVKDLGKACSDNSTCSSGFCADGVCCEEACEGECKSCNQPGKLGICSNVELAKADTYKVGAATVNCSTAQGFACNGSGACKLRGGVPCNGNAANCASGACSTTCTWVPGEACSKPSDCLPSLSCKQGSCQ